VFIHALQVMKKITGSIEAAGYAADNVAYGMGGGLLQKVSCNAVTYCFRTSF
jgi:nicotinamide phosphoribosyltransferase